MLQEPKRPRTGRPWQASSHDELAYCGEHGIAFLPWSPLGGTGGGGRSVGERFGVFAEIGRDHEVSAQQVVLAWELSLAPVVIPIPGARRAESIMDSAKAPDLVLSDDELARRTTSWKVVESMLGELGYSADAAISDTRRSPRGSSAGDVLMRGKEGAATIDEEGSPMTRFTPEQVRSLAPDEVFVFGSNASGHHGGGAARAAVAFGAVWGEGHGLHGQTYAIDTMSGLDVLAAEAEAFVVFAAQHPELTFLLTPVGCGIAGYSEDEVAPLFASAPENVVLPEAFARVLGR